MSISSCSSFSISDFILMPSSVARLPQVVAMSTVVGEVSAYSVVIVPGSVLTL